METYEKTFPYPGDKKGQKKKIKIPHSDVVVAFGIILFLLLVLAIAVPIARSANSTQEVSTLLTAYPIIDGHNEVLGQIYVKANNSLKGLTKKLESSKLGLQTDMDRMSNGGLGGQFWTIAVNCQFSNDAVRLAMDQLDTVKRIFKQNPGLVKYVNKSGEVIKSMRKTELTSLIGLSGGAAIDGSVRILRLYYELGVRYFSFAYDKCRPSWANDSLTSLGEAIVKEANRLGMIIDLSDLDKNVSIQIFKTTSAPVIYSHTAAYNLCNHYENIDDETLQLLARNKGIAMVTFASAQVNCNSSRQATVDDVADHLQHIYEVCGADCVGIGANFDSGRAFPEKLNDVSLYPSLLEILNARGWTKKDLTKLSQENIIRVMTDVEGVAKRILQIAETGPAEDNE